MLWTVYDIKHVIFGCKKFLRGVSLRYPFKKWNNETAVSSVIKNTSMAVYFADFKELPKPGSQGSV